MVEVGKKTGKQTQAGRDVYETPEGEMVSEKSTTFEYKGKWINIPTIHGGKQYSEDQLMEMLDKGLIKPTSTHDELEEAIQAAQSRSDSLEFNKGGTPMLEKQMELFEDGGLRDEGGMVDEESGNEVPVGSTRKEVRDDIPAMLSEGEFVFPADVVRYIGLENLMRIRQDAKQGLKQMEAMGQMGNGDEAVLPDDMPFGMMDLIIIEGEEDEEPQEKAQGGVIHANRGSFITPMFDPSNQDVREYKNEAGDSLFIPFLNGEPVYPIPAGYFPAGQMPTKTETEAIPTGGDDDDTPPPPQSEFQKAGGWGMDTSATDGKALDMWIKEAEKVSTFGNVAAGIGAAINPLLGGMIALANKQQKKQIVEMLDEKIKQARKTPIEGQVAALQDIKKRLTTDEGKGILGKVIDEITGTVTDALGLSEEEKKKAKVTSTVNTQQSPDEPDDKTEKDATNAVEQPDETAIKLIDNGILGPEDFAPKPPEAIPTAPETPTIASAPEIPTLQTPDKIPTGMGIQGFESSVTVPEEGKTPSTLPLRTEQAVVAAGMTKLQTALDEIRASQPYRGPVSGMTMQEKLEDPMAPFKKGWEKLTEAVSEVSTTDYTTPTQPTATTVSTGGGDDDGPSLAEQMQKTMQEKATESLKTADQKTAEVASKAKAGGASQAEVDKIKSEGAKVKEKLEQQSKGIKTGFKKGGLASRKK